jgi:hypothetical protein
LRNDARALIRPIDGHPAGQHPTDHRPERRQAAFEELTDPRLVAIYDAWGPNRTDTAVHVELAAELGAASVVDVG